MITLANSIKLADFFYSLFKYKTKEKVASSKKLSNLEYALSLQKENNFEKALKLYQEFEKNPFLTENEKSTIYNNITVCLYKLGKYQEAKAYFYKLFALQKALYFKDHEYYTITYAYTLAMGIEWFGLKKEDYSSFLENVIKDFYFLEDAKRLQKIIQSL